MKKAGAMRDSYCNYLSYLLRIWQDSTNGEWHATLQDVFQDKSFHFATLKELYVNLDAMTNDQGDVSLEQTRESFNGEFST
jgi:hypothetical protein